MGPIDDVTWQVLTVVLTLLGLVTSVVLWRRRGAASGVRGVAWSLLPLAALLTGTWRLLWEIGDAVVSWGVRFVFSPMVWLGVSIAGVSLVLFVAAAAMRHRGVGTQPRAVRSSEGRKTKAVTTGAKGSDPALDDELADIEAILKRRGIT